MADPANLPIRLRTVPGVGRLLLLSFVSSSLISASPSASPVSLALFRGPDPEVLVLVILFMLDILRE
jgi:hypothetical protein